MVHFQMEGKHYGSSEESDESNDDEDTSRHNKHVKKDVKCTKKWHSGPKLLIAFDDSGVGMQTPYKLPVDEKEVEYFRIIFDSELVSDQDSR